MNIIEKQIVKYFHAFRLQQADFNHAEILGWSSTAEQEARFNAIIDLMDFSEGTSILDLGCGYGDLKARLDQEYRNFDYIGLDHQAEFIASAQKRYKDCPKTWFHQVDVSNCQLPKVDLIIASGALSYYSASAGYYFDMIQRFYNAADRAFIFNMLDNKTFESGELIIAHDKEQIYKACKELCPNATLKEGYLVDDFTIRMAKE